MNRFLLCLFVVGLSCATPRAGQGQPSSSLGAQDYYPLVVGTRWTYEVKLLGDVRTMDVEIVRKLADGFVQDSTGAKFLVDRLGVRDERRYLLRSPLIVGTKWTNVVSVSSVETYEIIASDQPCDAPAGQWSGCVVVQSRNRIEEGVSLVNEMTFAPGVGMVRISTVLDSNGTQIPQSSLSLLRFVPAPG